MLSFFSYPRHVFRLLVALLCVTESAYAFTVDKKILSDGFTSIALVSPSNIKDLLVSKQEKKEAIKQVCAATSLYFKQYKWEEDPC